MLTDQERSASREPVPGGQDRGQRRLPPLILVIGGHDPSGAGIQADIETCFALGCHAATVVTALTVQNTHGVARILPVAPADVRAQVEHLLDDFRPFAACKIGLIPEPAVADAIAEILARLPPAAPVILDSVLAAGAGGQLARAGVAQRLHERLLPRVDLVTPNIGEAAELTRNFATATSLPRAPATGRGEADYAEMGCALNAAGCRYVLLTGADEPTAEVRHRLYRAGGLYAEYAWPRLAGHYHGSGCTLAASIAAYAARGADLEIAIARGQAYTWASLACAIDVGGAQLLPGRRRSAVPDDPD